MSQYIPLKPKPCGRKINAKKTAEILAKILIDDCDRYLLDGRGWHLGPKGHVFTKPRKGETQSFLSRMVLNAPKGAQVDHINGNKFDNRRRNLRLATNKQNSWNSSVRNIKKSSKYKGVYVGSSGICAGIKKDGKKKHLGYFKKEESAAKAYDRAARKLFGKYACVNFPKPGERSCLPCQMQQK